MAANSFPYSESITFGWETFKRNAFFLIGVTLAIAFMEGAVEFAGEMVEEGTYAEFVLNVVSSLVTMVLEMGLIVILLKLKDGGMPEFGDLFNRMPLAVNYIAASILYGLMVVFGLIFFIFPGIYFAVRFCFYGYIIVDTGAGPIEALRKAAQLSEGMRFEIFLFGLMVFGINVLGLLALGVGILATVPITGLAMAYLYRRLAPGAVHEPLPPGEAV